MLVPYHVDVPLSRWPIANWVIIGVTVVSFSLMFQLPEDVLLATVLGANPSGVGSGICCSTAASSTSGAT
jgi:hypothetical protein